MKITTLMEDTRTRDDIFCEQGLSLLVETRNSKILLDTGRTGRFVDNSRLMDVDLTQLDACVISHAHFDHGGGLARFFEMNQTTPIYMHQAVQGNYFANVCAKLPLPVSMVLHPMIRYSMPLSKYIGLDPAVLAAHQDRISFVTDPVQICDDTFILTDINGTHPRPNGNKFLLSASNDRLEPDRFRHEIILAVREPDGIILFSGCCHNGILNMIDRVNDYFGNLPIKAVVGGFHLVLQPGKDRMSLTVHETESLGRNLIDKGIQSVFTGHCTGNDAFEVLHTQMGERLHRLSTGRVFEI